MVFYKFLRNVSSEELAGLYAADEVRLVLVRRTTLSVPKLAVIRRPDSPEFGGLTDEQRARVQLTWDRDADRWTDPATFDEACQEVGVRVIEDTHHFYHTAWTDNPWRKRSQRHPRRWRPGGRHP